MAKRRAIKIEILPTERFDLQDIVAYIARDSIKYAKRERVLIIQAIEKLFDFPELGTVLDLNDSTERKLVFRNYLIIYRLKTEEHIEILTIHHHARLLSNNRALFDDDDEQ